MRLFINNTMETESIEDTADSLSHDDLLEVTQSSLSTLLRNDSLLRDLPDDIIVEEIQSQIAVEHGQSITIFINRENNSPMTVIVPQNATVRTLKKAITRHFELYQRRAGIKAKISWKYIWKTYNLNYDSTVLDGDDTCIQDYGVTNKVSLSLKRKKQKTKQI